MIHQAIYNTQPDIVSIADMPDGSIQCRNATGDIITPNGTEIPERDRLEAEASLTAQLNDISKQRYDMETADLVYDGATFPYTRDDRVLLDSAIGKIRGSLTSEILWKCKDSYYTLTTLNIDALELMGYSQVQDAFIWEKTQIEAL